MAQNDADLMSIGQHCSHPECSQLDFLPFKCDCCSKTFCLDHRGYAAHSCPAAGGRNTEVIVCPLCAKGVKLDGRDPNTVFEEHQRTACDPSNYAKVHKKPKCPVKGCKERLSTINTYHCQQCHQRVCLRHRDREDHGCAEAKAAAAAQRGGGGLLDRMKQAMLPTPAMNTASGARTSSSPGVAGPASTASAARPLSAQQARAAAMQQYTDPANSVRGTAARRIEAAAGMMVNPMHQSSGSARPTSNANPLVAPHLPEQCPQCGARFATVERLVQHVDDFHPAQPVQGAAPAQPLTNALTQAGSAVSAALTSGAQALANGWGQLQGGGPGRTVGGGPGEVYRCPHCAGEFQDAVLLVGHVERCTTAGSRGRPVSATGAAASTSKGECRIA